MSIINAIDKHTPKQYGENGHIEYSWSNDFQELFTQFYFQLVRRKNTATLESKLRKLLLHFKEMKQTHVGSMLKYENEFTNLYKLIGHTRDIKEGKGEYNLAYMQLWVWYEFFPTLAKKALKSFVTFEDMKHNKQEHPYGSWKDIKYFAEYVKRRSDNEDHPLIHYCVELILDQIHKDLDCLDNKDTTTNEDSSDKNKNNIKKYSNISLAGKWCPREKGRFSWLFKNIINKEYREFYVNAIKTSNKTGDKTPIRKAHRKACMLMNRKLSRLNKHLDTTQIKMCGKEWSSIDFNHVTSKTMANNRKAFLATNQNGKHKDDKDRDQCAKNLVSHVNEAMTGNTRAKIHGKRVNVYEFVKDAIRLFNEFHTSSNINNNRNSNNIQDEMNIINQQWKDNASQNHGLKNIIPMADTSRSMTCNKCIPLYNSIGLSIRISELTPEPFRNRIMTFSSKPEWVRLNDTQSFVEKVNIVSKSNWHMNTNFYAAMKMILDSALEAKLSPDEISNLTLAVFSDMQIDKAVEAYQSEEAYNEYYTNETTNETNRTKNILPMMGKIEKMYHDAGMRSSWKQPFQPPHILFWNLRSTSGFPLLSTQQNVTMLSGYSSMLLNAFCNKGIDELKTFTPYKMICDILSKPRYRNLSLIIQNYFCNK